MMDVLLLAKGSGPDGSRALADWLQAGSAAAHSPDELERDALNLNRHSGESRESKTSFGQSMNINHSQFPLILFVDPRFREDDGWC